jgi:hypothetical protein
MDRLGLADRICAGSGWVGIRPGAVEASRANAIRVSLSGQTCHGGPSVFARESSCDSCEVAKHPLPEHLQSELNLPRTCGCTGNGSGRGSP